jgi:hypothetical protein
MRKLALTLTLVAGVILSAISQTASIKGTVIDTAEKKSVANSVVALLRKSDSVLVKFTRTDASGNFQLQQLNQGKFFVLVTHPNYADYFTDLEIKESSAIDLSRVPMITKSQLLQEVIVRQQLGAIRQKKDTTEFIADSFKVAANANVEDLLRRLPGFQIDKDGKITAQGETVQKVLVDGEEFFGNDPTVATQNIRADNVEKVQVFDKKSDQAAFTGIDDGQKTKTINLKLKDNKKNGYFGKLSVGGGLKDKFNNQGMINAFKGKRKLAAFGTMANTGQTGLSWQDQDNYGGGNGEMIEMDEGTGFVMFSGGDNEFGGGGGFYGEGLPTGWSAGVHYNNKFNEAKHSLNGSYRFNKLNTIGGGATTTQYILPDTLFYRNQSGNNYQSRLRNLINGTYEMQIDSFSTLKITASGSIGKTEGINTSYSESLTEERVRINESNRNIFSKADNQNLTTTALYRKRFRKAGRTISFNFNQIYTNRDTESYLLSENTFYDLNGQPPVTDSVNQQKMSEQKLLTLAGKLAYTEPITKSFFMELSYSYSKTNSSSKRVTLGNINGKYEDFVDSLSTNYDFDILTNRGGLNFRLNKKKYMFSFGSDVSNSDFKQKDLFQDTSINYSYLNLFPKANFSYIFNPQKRLSFNYNGSTKQPTIDQIQPLRDNYDPLNVSLGNPDLKQEFRHNFGINYNDFKVMNSRSIWMSLSATTVDNAIGIKETFYQGGVRTYQPTNVKGNYTVNGYASYNFKIKKTDFNIGFNFNGNYTENNSVISTQDKNGNFVTAKNTTSNASYGGGLNFNYYKDKKFRAYLWSSLRKNQSKSTINENIETEYWSLALGPNAVLTLPGKVEIGTDAQIDLREKTSVFDQNRNVVKWNASLSKKFLKNESMIIRFEIRDILDQNIGFNRNLQSNNITERTYDTLRRFWLLSFTWNFSKNGKAPGM